MYKEGCIFCKIVSGQIPAKKVYEDADFLAFLDIHPYSVGHTLLIPKSHYRDVWAVPDELYEKFTTLVKKLVKHYREITDEEIIATLTYGEQVEHAHFHIIPNLQSGFAENFAEVDRNRLELKEEQFEEIQKTFKFVDL